MPPEQPREAWREVVRRIAQARAEAESRRKWQVEPPRPIPFNYRWEHVQTVVGLALRLAQELGGDLEVVEAAAWLHDICKTQPRHGEAGAQEAQEILAGTDFPAGKIPLVVAAIRQHVGLYREEGAPPLDPLEAAILWDADKLSKLGVQAIVYAMSAPYANGQGLTERRQRFTQFTRDVLARTVASMNTEPAQAWAHVRYRHMLDTLAHWAEEEEMSAT